MPIPRLTRSLRCLLIENCLACVPLNAMGDSLFFCGWYVALQSFILQLLFKELCFQLWSISLIREINWLILRLLHRICFCLFSFVLKEFSIFLLIYGNADVGKKKKKKNRDKFGYLIPPRIFWNREIMD